MTSLLKSFRSKLKPKIENANKLTNLTQSDKVNNDDTSNIGNQAKQNICLSNMPSDYKLKLITQLPTFSGTKTENFKTFLQIFESKILLLELDLKDKLALFQHCLHGQAAETFLKIDTAHPDNSWLTITEAFEKSMTKPVTPTITYQTLQHRKQHLDESIEHFADDIKTLVNKFYCNNQGYNQQLRDKQMVKLFKYGVIQPFKRQLKWTKFATLQEILMKTQQLRLQMQQHNDPNVPPNDPEQALWGQSSMSGGRSVANPAVDNNQVQAQNKFHRHSRHKQYAPKPNHYF